MMIALLQVVSCSGIPVWQKGGSQSDSRNGSWMGSRSCSRGLWDDCFGNRSMSCVSDGSGGWGSVSNGLMRYYYSVSHSGCCGGYRSKSRSRSRRSLW
jgi:hypothetical protein